MMINDMSQTVRRQLDLVVGNGHEEAMRRALAVLAADFDRWKPGEIDPFELADRIHKFHDGENREIYTMFSHRRSSRLPLQAVYCLNHGLVKAEDVPGGGDGVPPWLVRPSWQE
jgi:hypothetical protein